MLRETTYIEKGFWGILPTNRKIVPQHSVVVALLRRGTEASAITLLSCEVAIDEQYEHATTPVEKCVTISA